MSPDGLHITISDRKNIFEMNPNLSEKQVRHCGRGSTDFHRTCNFLREIPESQLFNLNILFFLIAKSLTIFSTILLCAFHFQLLLPSYEN